ncbi:hypothetical protein [Microbacterium gorillae]|uniref:hypothetical protein n=1 Tax=Microbacterium gorillae TaxID=1231063 RepID=UPI003D9883EA
MAWLRERPWIVGVGCLVMFGTIAGFQQIPAWVQTQGLPEEQVTVIERTDTGDSAACGRRGRSIRPLYEVVYESDNPPPGASRTFSNLEGCSPHAIGEHLTIVRSEKEGTTTVWFDHPDSLWGALWEVAVVSVPIAAAATAVGYGVRALSRSRERRIVERDEIA